MTEEKLNQVVGKLLKDQREIYGREKIRVTFDKPVSLVFARQTGSRTISKAKEVYDLKFFKSTQGLAYAHKSNSRVGYSIKNLPIESIVSVTRIPQKDWKAESQKLMAKIHDNAWQTLKEQLNDDGTHLRDSLYGNIATTSIVKKFPAYVIEELREAFEQQKDYCYRTYGQKRDLRVETKMGPDGEFRAWFSSEYAGCGNGDYWLLLNPTTAAFKETD